MAPDMKGASAMVKRVTGRLSGWYHARRRTARLLLAALPLVILVGLGWWGVRNMALRSADHLTVTITPIGGGGVIWQHTFGQKDAQQAQDLLNNRTIAAGPFSRSYGMVPTGADWHYHLAFTWHGILIETADTRIDIIPEVYAISSLGLPDLGVHWANSFSLLASIAPEHGVSILLPPGYHFPGSSSQ